MRSDSIQDAAPGDVDRQCSEAVRRGQRHHHQAMVSKSRGHRDQARHELRRAAEAFGDALRVDCTCASVYLLRARVLEDLGEDDLAEADLAQARRLGAAG